MWLGSIGCGRGWATSGSGGSQKIRSEKEQMGLNREFTGCAWHGVEPQLTHWLLCSNIDLVE